MCNINVYVDTSINDNHHHHHHHHHQHHHQLPSIQTLDVLSTKVHLAMANWWLLKLLFRAWKTRSPIPKKFDQKTQKRIPGWPRTNGFGWMNLYETQGCFGVLKKAILDHFWGVWILRDIQFCSKDLLNHLVFDGFGETFRDVEYKTKKLEQDGHNPQTQFYHKWLN